MASFHKDVRVYEKKKMRDSKKMIKNFYHMNHKMDMLKSGKYEEKLLLAE